MYKLNYVTAAVFLIVALIHFSRAELGEAWLALCASLGWFAFAVEVNK